MGVGRRIRVHHFITTEEPALLAETETDGLLHPPVINQKGCRLYLYLGCSFEILWKYSVIYYFREVIPKIPKIIKYMYTYILHMCSLSSTALLRGIVLRSGRERHKEAGFLADKDERVPGAKAKYRQCNYMSEHSAPLSSHLLFSLSVDLKSYFGHYAGRLWLFVCLWAAAKISLVCLFWFRTRLSPGAL